MSLSTNEPARAWGLAVFAVAVSAVLGAACWPFDDTLNECLQSARCYGGLSPEDAGADAGHLDGGTTNDSGTPGDDGGNVSDAGLLPDGGGPPDSGIGSCLDIGTSCLDPTECCSGGCQGARCCIPSGQAVTGGYLCSDCCSGACKATGGQPMSKGAQPAFGTCN